MNFFHTIEIFKDTEHVVSDLVFSQIVLTLTPFGGGGQSLRFPGFIHKLNRHQRVLVLDRSEFDVKDSETWVATIVSDGPPRREPITQQLGVTATFENAAKLVKKALSRRAHLN